MSTLTDTPLGGGRWTREERWQTAWQESADSLWAAREEDGAVRAGTARCTL